MAAISNSKWPIYTVFYRDQKIKLKSMSSCLSDRKDSKNVWFSVCPMFGTGNGVTGQNVKRSLTVALFWVKNDLDRNMPSDISNCSYDSRDSENARFYVISHS